MTPQSSSFEDFWALRLGLSRAKLFAVAGFPGSHRSLSFNTVVKVLASLAGLFACSVNKHSGDLAACMTEFDDAGLVSGFLM